jgi:diaminopimelate epimerase
MKFYKLQGTGNDFIIINNIQEKLPLEKIPGIAKRLCTPKRSLGADGLLLVEPPQEGGDIGVKVFNSDGSESEMCGNGMRCAARFAWEEGLVAGKPVPGSTGAPPAQFPAEYPAQHPAGSIVIETVAGKVEARRISKRVFRVRLQSPSVLETGRSVHIDGTTYSYTYVELGNPGIPHIVLDHGSGKLSELPLHTAGVPNGALRELARTLRHHPDFPKGANVNFFRITGRGVELLTFERGVEDFTLACGTGAGSTALSLVHQHRVQENSVTLSVPGGILTVDIGKTPEGEYEIFLAGDTNFVARGEILDDDL